MAEAAFPQAALGIRQAMAASQCPVSPDEGGYVQKHPHRGGPPAAELRPGAQGGGTGVAWEQPGPAERVSVRLG